jgi:iron complex transport system ATP-binding protein
VEILARMSTLALSNVSAGYGDHLVLRGIDLEVRAGEIVAVVGPNGAGKSTLIRAISGTLAILSGSIRLDGHDLPGLRPAERARLVAVVPQAASLPEAFTVSEIVLMGRTPHLPLWGKESRRDCQIAWEAIQRTALEEIAERRAGELSGGERQRVVVARALAQEPRVLLMDEATAHLDLKHQVSTLDLIRALARDSGLTVLASLHDLNQVPLFADRVALLAEGRVRVAGPPAAVLTSAHLSEVYGLPVEVITDPKSGTPLVLAGRARRSPGESGEESS